MNKIFRTTSLIKFSILSFLAFPLISCEAEDLPFKKDASTDETEILTHDFATKSTTHDLKESPDGGGGGDPEAGGGFNYPDNPNDYDPGPNEGDEDCWGMDCDNEDPPSGGSPEPGDDNTNTPVENPEPPADFEHADDVDGGLN